MPDRRDELEPILADRRRVPEATPEPAQLPWRMWIAVGGGVAAGALLVWLIVSRLSVDTESTSPTDAPEPTARQEPALPPPPESVPERAPQSTRPTPPPPAAVSLRFTSPDARVRFELSGPLEVSPSRTSRYQAGESGSFAPGAYKIVATGPQLLRFEKDITLAGENALEYAVELCVAPKREVKELVGQVVEEKVCAGTAQCQSVFLMLNEQADNLVKDRAFRSRQCAAWRAGALPQPNWALDTKCDDGSLAVACRIQIAQGSCAFSDPPRSARGGQCPQGVLQ